MTQEKFCLNDYRWLAVTQEKFCLNDYRHISAINRLRWGNRTIDPFSPLSQWQLSRSSAGSWAGWGRGMTTTTISKYWQTSEFEISGFDKCKTWLVDTRLKKIVKFCYWVCSSYIGLFQLLSPIRCNSDHFQSIDFYRHPRLFTSQTKDIPWKKSVCFLSV